MVQESNFRSEILRQVLEANKKFSFDDWRRAAFDTRVLGADKHLLIEPERPFDITICGGPDVHYYDLAALISSADADVLVAEFDSKVIASAYAKIDTSETSTTFLSRIHVCSSRASRKRGDQTVHRRA